MKVYKPLPIRLLTHNIRYTTDQPFKGEEIWGVHRSRLIQMMVPEISRYGDSNTLTGFDSKNLRRIDFIFVNKDEPSSANGSSERDSPERWWLVENFAVLPNKFEDGLYISDHQLVVGDVSMV